MSTKTPDPFDGVGGSYRKNKDGTRELLHRTAPAADALQPDRQPAAAGSGRTTAPAGGNVSAIDDAKKK